MATAANPYGTTSSGYARGEKPARRGRLVCPECESKADQDGYCTEPGCRMEGKSVAGALPIYQDRRA